MRGEINHFLFINLVHFQNTFVHLNGKVSFSLTYVHMQGLVPDIVRENINAVLTDLNIRVKYLLAVYIVDEPSVPQIFHRNIFSD